MEAKQYRKRAVVIEAVQFTGTNSGEIEEFVGAYLQSEADANNPNHPANVIIPTPEGDMRALAGDYIIRGIKGEYYPCKPDIFEKTYDEVVVLKGGDNCPCEAEPTRNLDFGQAIRHLKHGSKVARDGWNGKGMFLFLLPAGTIPKEAIHDPMLRLVLENNGKDSFEALASIRMKTADGKILTGWLASQTDMLAEDWIVWEDWMLPKQISDRYCNDTVEDAGCVCGACNAKKNLTKEALAEMLNDNEYGDEITKEQEALAKENNLVVLFPYSDDNLEARGAIYDELGAYEGRDFALIKKGEMFKAEDDEPDVFHKAEEDIIVQLVDDSQPEAQRKIALVWIAGANTTKAWNMTTELPHAKFTIKEDGEVWADGIVIDLDEIQ